MEATGSSAQIKFNYERLVWSVDYAGAYVNGALRAPKRSNASGAQTTGSLKVSLFSNNEVDNLFMLESENNEPYFENGYDAHKMFDGGSAIYSIYDDDEMSVDATNSIIGTRIGVRTSEETAYTLTFSHVRSENEMALVDTELDEVIDINEGTMYTFFAEPNSVISGRFYIIEREAPTVTTGVDGFENDVRATKFVKDNQLYILKNGVLYNAMGAVVR